MGLDWEEKLSFLKYEIVGFTIRKKQSYSASAIRLKMKKCVEPLQKQTMGVAFFSQNSQLLTFSLPTKEIFSCTRPKSACGKSSSCRFSFSATRNTITQVKDLTLCFSFRILFYILFQEILSNIVCQKHEFFFFFFLAAIIRENLDMRPWIDLTQQIVILNTCKKLS